MRIRKDFARNIEGRVRAPRKETGRCSLPWATIATSWALMGILLAQAAAGAEIDSPPDEVRAQDIDALRAAFREPPLRAGPWVYWFWWDTAVTKEEISRELEEMAAAGIAGAEIRSVDAEWLRDRFEEEFPRTGHKPLGFLSPEYLECLEHACATAQRLGMHLGINLGMGWPPGGTWITPEHQSKQLLSESRIVAGGDRRPMEIRIPESVQPADWVLAWRLDETAGNSVVPGSFVDLGGNVVEDGTKVALNIPAGRWLVGFFHVAPGGPLDKATGFPADPGSGEAMGYHLSYFFNRLDPVLSRYYGNTLTDVASDSWEYDGAPYWTPRLPESFVEVTGSSLFEKLYVMFNYGPDQVEIRRHLDEAENTLVQRNFFQRITAEANRRGLRHRPQARGRGLYRDLFEAYANSDIPEFEQEIYPPEAVWSAHVLGKPIVGVEAFTFLSLYNKQLGEFGAGFGAWQLNPDLLRRHANLLFAQGANRIQMHSFSYSPPSLELLGWRMYAEIHLNRNLTWWPYIGSLNRSLARNQLVLQAGIPVADVVVSPLTPGSPNPGGPGDGASPASARNGIDALPAALLGRLAATRAAGRYDFQTLVVTDALSAREEIDPLVRLLNTGIRVVFAGRLPDDWPILRRPAAGDAAWAAGVQRHLADAYGLGKAGNADAGSIPEVLHGLRSVQWTPADAQLSYQHRRLPGGEIWYLTNHGPAFDGEVSFPDVDLRPEEWDADTGIAQPVGRYRMEPGRVVIPLALETGGSTIVAFTAGQQRLHATAADGGRFSYNDDGTLQVDFSVSGYHAVTLSDGTSRSYAIELPSPVRVQGPWTLSAETSDDPTVHAPVGIQLENLVSWRELEPLKNFSGTGSYHGSIALSDGFVRDGLRHVLELGDVYEVAEVRVNGHDAGVTWIRPYLVDVSGLLHDGRNELEIRVTNHDERPVPSESDMIRPGRPRASGLLGVVELRAYARHSIGATTPIQQ